MPSTQEILRIENYKVEQFVRLGLTIREAIEAIEDGVDWHDLEDFKAKHPNCATIWALKIVR